MLNFSNELQSSTEPIRVGLIGAGVFGSQLVYGIEEAPGMETVIIADLETEKAINTYRNSGVSSEAIKMATSVSDADSIIRDGNRAIVTDGVTLIETDIDVIIEATGNARSAAKHAYKAILEGKHTVQVTVEADTVVGPLLAKLAERSGVTYTLAYGDQPAQIAQLCDWAQSSGLKIVAAGRWANNPEPYGTPDDALKRHDWIGSFVEKYDPSPYIYNSFLDGTKMAVESCVAANTVGLQLDTSGMFMPESTLEEIPRTLRLEEDGGLLSQCGVIDVINATDEGYSVFVVTKTDNEQRQKYFNRRGNVPSASDGKYQLFYRHFHVASETTVSIAAAALRNEATGVPKEQCTELVAAAKRDLVPGDKIDGAGGYTVYGKIETSNTATEERFVPFELLNGAEVVQSVDTDKVVTYDDVCLKKDSILYQLRKLQDDLCIKQ